MIDERILEKKLPPNPFRNDKPQGPHTKLYLEAHSANNLSGIGKTLLVYIMLNVKPGKDHIEIDSQHFYVITGIHSRTTLGKAKKELMQYQFIAPTAYRSVYFINPKYFFRHE